MSWSVFDKNIMLIACPYPTLKEAVTVKTASMGTQPIVGGV